MTGVRHASIALTVLLAACGQSYQPSNEFKQATPGASITIEAGDADVVDRIAENVRKRLIREPVLATDILSHGHAAATSYSLRFRGCCADADAMIALVRSEARPVTSAPPICQDR